VSAGRAADSIASITGPWSLRRGRSSARTGAARSLTIVGPPLLAFLLLLSIWQGVSTAGLVPADMLPSPTRIISAGSAERDALLRNTIPTTAATITGFALSMTLAFLVATTLDFSGVLEKAVLPLLIISQTLPLIALAPLVVLWFGFGLLPKILLVAFVTFFPMVVGLMRGFESTDPEAEHLLRSMGATRLMVFRMVRLPASVPSFFSSLRISITYAVVGAIFAEYAGAVNGLGVYMQSAKHVFRTDLVLAAVLVSTLLTLALYGTVVLVERVFVQWLRIERSLGKGATR
jgi:ABC-type nitrate/sulfonate/bicarbonate transport system permease component